MELVLEQRASKFFLDQSFALTRMLPSVEPHLFHKCSSDVRDDSFHDDVRIAGLGFAE